MKIVFDTVTKQAICPPEFFESIRRINDASELTESTKKVTSEDYLQKIIKECSKVIVNKSDITKRRTSKKIVKHTNSVVFGNTTNSLPTKIGNLVIEPTDTDN